MKNIVDLSIDKEKGIALMTFHQFTFDLKLIRKVNELLDELDKVQGPLCLITTSSNQKIYSAGLNFDVFRGHYEDVHNFIREFCRLLGRLLRLNYPSIACINGHCLAGGFMFAMSHDIRIISSNQKIKLGMTEINLGMTIPPQMNAPLEAKLSKYVLRQICLFGETVNPKKCLTYGIVDQIFEPENLLKKALEIAENKAILGENRLAYGGIKWTLYDQYIEQAEDGSPDEYTKKIVYTMNAKLQLIYK